MIIGRVYGSVVSTHKLEGLVGYKFMQKRKIGG